MNNLEILNGFSDLEKTLVHLSKDYIQSAYISIGSKINENIVHLGKDTTRSNSIFQMIPQFLQNPESNSDKLKCIIVIDQFNKSSLNENIRQLQHYMTRIMKIVIINYEIKESEETYFQEKLQYLFQHFIFLDPEEIMICNYVKFLNEPNLNEKYTKEMVPRIIQDSLKDSKFKDCHYEWFGYNSLLYNFIYKKISYMNLYNSLLSLKHVLTNKTYRNANDEKIAKNVFNITDFEYFSVKGPPSLNDILSIYMV